MKFVDGDLLIPLACELGERLTKVAVVVNDLVDGEPLLQELVAVHRCARPRARRVVRGLSIRFGTSLGTQLFDELRDEPSDPVRGTDGRCTVHARRRFRTTPLLELFMIL
ncbi:MAG: hypothetical protein ABI591_23100 [Kofleriaceae bacterium]